MLEARVHLEEKLKVTGRNRSDYGPTDDKSLN